MRYKSRVSIGGGISIYDATSIANDALQEIKNELESLTNLKRSVKDHVIEKAQALYVLRALLEVGKIA